MSETDGALARMALDFLSVPGSCAFRISCIHQTDACTTATSVEAERAFSSGRLTVSRLRHSLSDASVRASTLLGSWASIPSLVPESDIVNLIRETSERQSTKGKERKADVDAEVDVINVDSDAEAEDTD